jgi:Na+(H+)/acetate symporter ActP
MWGERGNSSQDIIQAIILIVAFICIPVMLVPKPCIEIRKHKKVEKNKIYKKQSNPLAEEQ